MPGKSAVEELVTLIHGSHTELDIANDFHFHFSLPMHWKGSRNPQCLGESRGWGAWWWAADL